MVVVVAIQRRPRRSNCPLQPRERAPHRLLTQLPTLGRAQIRNHPSSWKALCGISLVEKTKKVKTASNRLTLRSQRRWIARDGEWNSGGGDRSGTRVELDGSNSPDGFGTREVSNLLLLGAELYPASRTWSKNSVDKRYRCATLNVKRSHVAGPSSFQMDQERDLQRREEEKTTLRDSDSILRIPRQRLLEDLP
jgi:hypothetical protein